MSTLAEQRYSYRIDLRLGSYLRRYAAACEASTQTLPSSNRRSSMGEMQTPPPDSMPSNYPRPNLATDKQVLREVAAAQRLVVYCVLGQIAFVVVRILALEVQMLALWVVLVVGGLGLIAFQVISVVRLAKPLKEPTILYGILMFIPYLSFIMLVVISGKATKLLKEAGIKVGLMGADPNSI
jgi:hypothetical protein